MGSNSSKIVPSNRDINSRMLIDGYIHELQIKLSTQTIPTSINTLIFQYFYPKYTHSQLVFITHDNKPDLEKIEPYSSRAGDQCIATFKLFNLNSCSSQSIKIVNDKLYNDARQCYGLCYIPNIDILPSIIKSAENVEKSGKYSLLYRFGETIECIAFNSNVNQHKIKAQVTKLPNNDPGKNKEIKSASYRKYFPMKHNHKRNSILFVGGVFGGYGWGFSRDGDIGEYNIHTNEIKLLGHSGGSRAVWPNICLLDNDDKLFICGGRTSICMTDSLCPCSIQKSVSLFDIESKQCKPLKEMHIRREGHGCCYNYGLNRVIVGGGTTDWRDKPVMDSKKSVEIYDIEKDEWYLIDKKCNYEYRYGNVWYEDNNPFIINICGFGRSKKWNGPHCEYIDVRENKQEWMVSDLDKPLSQETNFMRIVM